MIRIDNVKSGFEPQKLMSPFGFKGNYLTELWQSVAVLSSEKHQAMGLGTQSVLWSDADIFASYGEAMGNKLMLDVTKYALNLIKGAQFEKPYQLLFDILPEVYSYARKITNNEKLKKTFALNSLVAVDNALWALYAKENKILFFDQIIGGTKQDKLLNIPLISYAVSNDEIDTLLKEGSALLKIKIGSNPNKNNDLTEMLEWDKNRLFEIHKLASQYRTDYTVDNRIHYYLDANGSSNNSIYSKAPILSA